MGSLKKIPYTNVRRQILSFVAHHLKKNPRTFSVLFLTLLFLAWISLSLHLSASQFLGTHRRWTREDDLEANLVRFKSKAGSPVVKDSRGWLLDPVSLALAYGVKGGALSCASVHVGEIRPGGVRGNHRHYTCNETLVIWGANTKFRVEKNGSSTSTGSSTNKGYAEAVIAGDEIGVAASTMGTAHAIVNVDAFNTTFFIACQDCVMIQYDVDSSSSTDFKVWPDLSII